MAAAAQTGETFKTTFGKRLEPYLALSKSAKGAGCVQLIKDALTAPGVLVFGELLDMPNVVEIKSHADYGRYYRLLEIFSFGTFQDYQQNKETLPEITDVQRTKLQQLSIVTLSERVRAIPYKDLLEYLEIANVRQLEDLIMDAIYQNIINASLDQKLKQVEVHSAMGRDLRPGQAQVMLKVLRDWARTSETLLTALDIKMREVQVNYEREKQAKEAFEQKLEKIRKENQSSGAGKHRKIMGGGSHLMDYEMGDQHMFQSSEFISELERVSYGGNPSKKGGKRIPNRG